MNGNADRSTGLESADTSSAADHPKRIRDCIAGAYDVLEGCNKQEAQEARRLLLLALTLQAEEDLRT